jgi:hypothetical protein
MTPTSRHTTSIHFRRSAAWPKIFKKWAKRNALRRNVARFDFTFQTPWPTVAQTLWASADLRKHLFGPKLRRILAQTW